MTGDGLLQEQEFASFPGNRSYLIQLGHKPNLLSPSQKDEYSEADDAGSIRKGGTRPPPGSPRFAPERSIRVPQERSALRQSCANARTSASTGALPRSGRDSANRMSA
jgi:hypothetical protein